MSNGEPTGSIRDLVVWFQARLDIPDPDSTFVIRYHLQANVDGEPDIRIFLSSLHLLSLAVSHSSMESTSLGSLLRSLPQLKSHIHLASLIQSQLRISLLSRSIAQECVSDQKPHMSQDQADGPKAVSAAVEQVFPPDVGRYRHVSKATKPNILHVTFQYPKPLLTTNCASHAPDTTQHDIKLVEWEAGYQWAQRL